MLERTEKKLEKVKFCLKIASSLKFTKFKVYSHLFEWKQSLKKVSSFEIQRKNYDVDVDEGVEPTNKKIHLN